MAKSKSSGVAIPASNPMLSNFKGKMESYMADVSGSIKIGEPEQNELRGFIGTMFKNSEVYSFVTGDAITDLANGGTLKNIFEMGESDKEFKEERAAMAEKLFGADISSLQNSDYEKYGVIGSSDANKFLSSGTNAEIYGDFCIKFKKDSLANMVTYTFGDSYNMSAHDGDFMAGGFGKDLSITGVPVQDMPLAYKKMKQLSNNNPSFDGTDVAKAVVGKYGYIEAQLHKKITLGDISEIYVKAGNGASLSTETIDSLEKSGVKVVYKKW